MHEYSLASEILRIVLETAQTNQLGQVATVQLEVGMASGVSVEAIAQAWEILRAHHTVTAQAALSITRPSAYGDCPACGYRGAPFDTELLLCPLCGEGGFKLERGKEFLVTAISGTEGGADC